ncbi:hypothetical protein I3842_09G197300 [Carya illinoinensis]|uniref:Fe2OG dioxygenase domain-containing protein n=1 Tax=Carya illinoinensis TaxID=32201 RepID=A0A922E8Q7_CARIL|nr:hypothetical protein I3842_09G197300 [Carya illinoinensis]
MGALRNGLLKSQSPALPGIGNMDSNIKEFAEETYVPTFAPSLPVPNAQEMMRSDPFQVPERYARNHDDMQSDTVQPHLSFEIPVLDLSLLSKGDAEELKRLDLACKDWGFFQVINHGVASEVLQNTKDVTAEFFDLPLEEKNRYSMPSDDIQGYGHAYVVSEEQTLDWSDALILVVYPTQYRKLQLWPNQPTGIREAIEMYSSEVRRMAVELLGSLSLIMGTEKDALLGLHKELVLGLRVNYYPPCRSPDKVLGLSPHSDSSTITILMQKDDVCGLQVRHGGAWVPLKPIPNALVVNVGDAIEIWSNGKYKSIEHRAVTNESKARISYAAFVCPHDDVEIEPLGYVPDAERSDKMYKKVRFGDYLRQSMNRKLDGKANIDFAKMETLK